MIAVALLRETGTVVSVGWYMIAAVAIALLCASLLTSATAVRSRGALAA
jgi:hypothetical protein